MHRLIFVTCFAIILCGCERTIFTDTEKIAKFEQLCKEQASEQISENSADGSAILSGDGQVSTLSDWSVSDEFRPTNEPLGSAKLSVLDLEYSPAYLLRDLFSGYDPLREVVFLRGSTGTNPSIPEACRITHYLSVKSKEESEAAFLNLCDLKTITKFDENIRYYIGGAYGEIDAYEIRKFVFYVKDRKNGRILAEQRSYQLLMGGMMSQENRIRLGWGSSQGVRTCKLTPPDQFVKRVFR